MSTGDIVINALVSNIKYLNDYIEAKDGSA